MAALSVCCECADLTAALLTTRSPAQPSSIFQIKLQQQRQINVSIKTIIVKRRIVHYRLQYRQATSQPIAWPYTRLGTLAAVTMVMVRWGPGPGAGWLGSAGAGPVAATVSTTMTYEGKILLNSLNNGVADFLGFRHDIDI